MSDNESRRHARFYFDYISHNAYLGWSRLDDLSDRYGLDIDLVPVLFAGLLKASGQLGPAEVPAKNRWMARDVIRKAALIELPLAPPASHPFNPLTALRVTVMTQDPGQRSLVVARLFDATWASGLDVSDPEVIRAVLSEAGLDGTALLRLADSEDAKRRLRDNTEAAIAAGVFGVPTILVDDQLFWGYDDIRYLELYLQGHDPLGDMDISDWWQVRPSTQRRR